MALSERQVQSLEFKRVLGLWGLNWDEDNPGSEVKVWKVGGVAVPLVWMFAALGSCFRCSSMMCWADSWSSTYITWVPTSRLMYIGECPERKSLT